MLNPISRMYGIILLYIEKQQSSSKADCVMFAFSYSIVRSEVFFLLVMLNVESRLVLKFRIFYDASPLKFNVFIDFCVYACGKVLVSVSHSLSKFHEALKNISRSA